MTYMLALDQGTTSSRAVLFDREGRVVGMEQREFPQYFPRPGWVEHEAGEIWASQVEAGGGGMGKCGVNAREVAAVGIANQRETVVVSGSGRRESRWGERGVAGSADGGVL